MTGELSPESLALARRAQEPQPPVLRLNLQRPAPAEPWEHASTATILRHLVDAANEGR